MNRFVIIHSNATRHKKQRCKITSVTTQVPAKKESNNHKDGECSNAQLGTAEVVMSTDP
jgi:hypothetical protein